MLICKPKNYVLTGELIQGLGYTSVILDKLLVKVIETKEQLDTFH